MTITITKLTDREFPEHYRILVSDGNDEVHADSASTLKQGCLRAADFLQFYGRNLLEN